MKRDGEPIKCLVPFCKEQSWKYRFSTEYLCGKHHRLADAGWRALRARLRRQADKAEHQGFDVTQSRARANEIWDKRIKPQALARAMAEPEEIDETPKHSIPRARRVKPDF